MHLRTAVALACVSSAMGSQFRRCRSPMYAGAYAFGKTEARSREIRGWS